MLAVFVGLYVGLWIMFVGGIIQLVQSCIPTTNALGILLGILRISFASIVGWFSFNIIYLLGFLLLEYKIKIGGQNSIYKS